MIKRTLKFCLESASCPSVPHWPRSCVMRWRLGAPSLAARGDMATAQQKMGAGSLALPKEPKLFSTDLSPHARPLHRRGVNRSSRASSHCAVFPIEPFLYDEIITATIDKSSINNPKLDLGAIGHGSFSNPHFRRTWPLDSPRRGQSSRGRLNARSQADRRRAPFSHMLPPPPPLHLVAAPSRRRL